MGWMSDLGENLTDVGESWNITGTWKGQGGYLTGQTAEDRRKQAERDNQLTPEEAALYEEQLALLNQEAAMQDELEPFILESLGLKRNASGQLEEIPGAEVDDEILAGYKSYQLKALAGELPVSP